MLFCEDFESLPTGAVDTQRWRTDTRQGTLTVEPATIPSGPTPSGPTPASPTPSSPSPSGPDPSGKVLHVHTDGNGAAFMVVPGFAPPGNSFFGRMRVRVDRFPVAPDWAHFTLVEASGQAGGGVVRPIGGQYVPTAGRALWGVGSDGGPTGDWTDWRESAPAASGRWLCLEWQLAAADNRIAVWIDGTPQPDLSVSTTRHGGNPVDFVFPRFDTIRIGWQLYQGNPTPDRYDLWLDDVALGTDRIGC